MTSDDISCSFRRVAGACNVHWRVEEQLETQVARATSYDHQILRPSRLVNDKAVWAARVPRKRSGSEESEAARGNFPGLTAARVGASIAFG